MKVCGEIDEEISIPELVKDHNLCPHQDYVYFNYPTSEELEKIHTFKQRRDEYCDLLMMDIEFQKIILSHKCFKKTLDYDQLLENPAYLSSILIYVNATGHKISGDFKKLLGYTRLEKLSPKWLEILLQGVLYDDSDAYEINDETITKYRHELKLRGLIEKRKVTLQLKQSLKKDLMTSIGKCESIKDITFNEYQSMGKELRLLILCDYIKKEYLKAVGNMTFDTHALGVIPYFELLRRENVVQRKNLKLGVLCGSIAIIPTSATSRLLELVENPLDISFKDIGDLSNKEYVEVDVRGNRHFLTAIITQLFEEGYIETLIGTKSLLGEGWDSPCVNSLILASFVGSFMLSNQMRGRAIRTYAKNLNKSSNIWHLVCVIPENIMNQFEKTTDNLQPLEDENQDMELLKRRMENFLGLHYEIDSIESGMNRLSTIVYPIEKKANVKKNNAKMLEMAAKRDLLKYRWDQSLIAMNQMEIVDEVCKQPEPIRVVALFDYIRYMFLSFISIALTLMFYTSGFQLSILFTVIMLMGLFSFIVNSTKFIQMMNPLKVLQKLGEGVRQSLLNAQKFDMVDHRVETVHDQLFHQIYLVGGTGHDKALFAQCISDMFDDIDAQRYILYAPHRKHKKDGYFPVPEIFSKRKEDATIFASCMKKYIGKYELVYTRNSEGRKILLKGRVYALANKQNRAIQRKRVKSALE